MQYMGLDSVQLIFEIEKQFDIEFTDEEASKIFTVEDLVTSIGLKKEIIYQNSELKDSTVQKITSYLKTQNFKEVSGDAKISNYINQDNVYQLEQMINLKIPIPEIKSQNTIFLRNKIKQILKHDPNYDWSLLTIEDFVTAIHINNFQKLTSGKNLKSVYEVYIICCGIMSETMDIDCYEFSPSKLIVTDLEID
jgi:hypothetical protein